MKRLAILADHFLTVRAIRAALRHTAGLTVVGSFDGCRYVPGSLAAVEAELVVVDDMGRSVAAQDRLRDAVSEVPDAHIILLSSDMSAETMDDAFDAGATAVISKTVHPVALGTLLRETARGTVVHRPRPPRSTATDECPLTPRELEILRLAAQGLTNGRIARELWVTEQTVKFHLSNTYRKLGVNNRTQASQYAHANDLVPPVARLAS